MDTNTGEKYYSCLIVTDHDPQASKQQFLGFGKPVGNIMITWSYPG